MSVIKPAEACMWSLINELATHYFIQYIQIPILNSILYIFCSVRRPVSTTHNQIYGIYCVKLYFLSDAETWFSNSLEKLLNNCAKMVCQVKQMWVSFSNEKSAMSAKKRCEIKLTSKSRTHMHCVNY